ADEEQRKVSQPEERRDHQAGEYRTKAFLPARGQERHPTGLLPDRDEKSDENEVEQVGRKELRKPCAKCAQAGRTLDHGAPDEQEQRRAEQRKDVPLRTGAPREVSPAKVADSVLAVGDPRDQERPAREGDERQEPPGHSTRRLGGRGHRNGADLVKQRHEVEEVSGLGNLVALESDNLDRRDLYTLLAGRDGAHR